jgi:hypothetical protein
MSYRLGYCPQTGEKIMVQDSDGAWNSKKKNWRQADLIFSNGRRCRTAISETALAAPDYTVLINEITDPNSQAADPATLDMIKEWGAPIGIEDRTRS